MSSLKRIILEIHRRSIWQVLGIYLAASWLVLQIVDVLADSLTLPDWFAPLAVVLLLVGLPIVLATAFVQEGPPTGTRREPASISSPTPPSTPSSPSSPPRSPHRLLTWRNAAAGGVLAAAAWGVIAAGWLFMGAGRPVDAASPVASHSVAALPFENLSPDESDRYFADGIHEEVLSHLSKLGSLRVISRTSVLGYRGGQKNLRTIGEELGADHVLEGSVRRAGDRVRITMQLIDARTDVHLWSETYDRDYTAAEVFDIQSDIANRVAGSLQATLSPETRRRLATRPTENIEAYDLYLRARDHLVRASGLSDTSAVRLLQRAVELDERFALGYANLAIAQASMYWYGVDRRSERLDLAKTAADRALTLDPRLPEGHLALAYYHYFGRRDYGRALEELRRAEEGMPGSAEIMLVHGAIRRRQGDFDAAAAHFARAFELDPRNDFVAFNLAETLRLVGRYDEALRAHDRSIELNPTYPGRHDSKAFTLIYRDEDVAGARRMLQGAHVHVDSTSLWESYWTLELLARDPAAALTWALLAPDEIVGGQYGSRPRTFYTGEANHRLGRLREASAQFDSARVVLERMIETEPDNETATRDLAWVYARLGRREEAIATGRKAVELMPLTRDAFIGQSYLRIIAAVFAQVGEPASAIEMLEGLAEKVPKGYLRPMDPVWDPIRDEPRFRALITG